MTRFVCFLLLTAVGCATPSSEPAPEVERQAPERSEGDATSGGCDGVTARGECRQGMAVYCDLAGDRLRAFDCAGNGEKCVIDLSRGAICQPLADEPGYEQQRNSPCWDTGIGELGFCTADGAAVYCDTSGAMPQTKVWSCADEGLRCKVSICANGASCCEDTATDAPEPPVASEDECGELSFAGSCDGEGGGRYCLDGVVREFQCSAGQTCGEFVCGVGALCCGETRPPANECQELGVLGTCTDDGHVRYCLGDSDEEIIDYECDAGESCQENECGSGAHCCPAG